MTYEEALNEWGWRLVQNKAEREGLTSADVVSVSFELGTLMGGGCETCEYSYATHKICVAFEKGGKRTTLWGSENEGDISLTQIVSEIAAIANGG